MKWLAPTLVVLLVVVACASPIPSTPSVPTANPNASPSGIQPPETALCEPYDGLLPSGIDRDSCPPAIAAVRAAVAPLNLRIARIAIQPGVFPCDDPWPRAGSSVSCASPGPSILAGTTMHGWVTFTDSFNVAAVRLTGNLAEPYVSGTSIPTTAPILVWEATIAAFIVPPVGWVMP